MSKIPTLESLCGACPVTWGNQGGALASEVGKPEATRPELGRQREVVNREPENSTGRKDKGV
jgi:hypothetical protein